MICKKCGSQNVSVQAVTTFKIQSGHGCLWWAAIGWWLLIIKFFIWIFAFVPMLILKLIKGKKYKIKSKISSEAVCQNCGNIWKV